MKEMSWTNISKQCHNSCYFGCCLLSDSSQFFCKPVALDRFVSTLGVCASVQLVSSIWGLELLPCDHRITSITVFSSIIVTTAIIVTAALHVKIVTIAWICSIPSYNNVDCCVMCIERCIVMSDMKNKGEIKMLEEHPPQKIEHQQGCRGGWAPVMLIVVLSASKDASWWVIWKTKGK